MASSTAESYSIEGPQGFLQASLAIGHTDRPVIILCHPHPAYGGNFDNSVLALIGQQLSALDFSVLYFNFSGVGASSGQCQDASDGAEDVRAVWEFARKNLAKPVWFAGYSFGAAALLSIKEIKIDHPLLLLAPVLSLCTPNALTEVVASDVIVGSQDQFVETGTLIRYFGESSVAVIEGADHFFYGYDDLLEAQVRRWCGAT
ncbi:MAG: hypothetical protein ISP92_06280 [Pseudomonadales bacterium]|jgi:alpha/beta superfamily hydrolase|nr:hypothetical protein [Pseudomonadales bacterium]MDA0761648.1 hypothetical protein [Pseudomonadota bacterium]MDA0957116.1 hypothetical protein [Pseudomonadota bacterium]MDA1206535.1 hypothetical protein [Pseudomonadota bacterium]